MKKPSIRLKSLVKKHLNSYVTQNEHKIDELYKCYGISNFLENSEKITKKKNLRKNIFNLIKKRHLIVHDCDTDRRGKIRHIGQKESKRIIKQIVAIKELVDGSEKILRNKGI